MAQTVVSGALLKCSFGAAVCNLNVTSQTIIMMGSKPTATIQDCQMANISGFGMCSSLANPQVAAATAAALGVLTPQPCMPAAAGTWLPVKPNIMIKKIPCLLSNSMLFCTNGAGVITITSPGQWKVNA